MCISNLNANINCKHLNVVIMMRMTYTSLCNFMKTLTWAWYEAFGHHGGTKGVPRQLQRKWCHGNIPGDPTTHWDVSARENLDERIMWGWWGDPGYRVPHGSTAWQPRRNVQWQLGHGSNMSISYNMHSFLEGRLDGYTFAACVIGGVQVRCGVGEVDILGTLDSGSRGTRRW